MLTANIDWDEGLVHGTTGYIETFTVEPEPEEDILVGEGVGDTKFPVVSFRTKKGGTKKVGMSDFLSDSVPIV